LIAKQLKNIEASFETNAFKEDEKGIEND